MKQKSVSIAIVLALFVALLALRPRTARADEEVSPEFYYDTLSPYGEWVNVGDYGACWHPKDVDENWAPYTDGYWAYTDAGWTWVSYEDYGGIVYHYGRWMRVEGEGWVWAPGYEWAPAWVSWRRNDDYIGWAPLPPEARWRGDVGFSVWVDSEYDIGPRSYSFCRQRDFGAPVLRGVIVGRDENVVLIGSTRNITNITSTNFGGVQVVFNGGPDFALLRGVTARPIPALRLSLNSRFDPALLRGPGAGKLMASRMVGGELIVGAPRIAAPADPNFFRARVKKFIEPGRVTRGWAGIKDPAVLRRQIQAQTTGLKPESAHAHPVAAVAAPITPAHANAAVDPAGNKGFEKEKAAKIEAERAADLQREKAREALAKQGQQGQQGQRTAPHEDPRFGHPTPAASNTGRKGNEPPAKDKDKKDKDRPGF